MQATLTKDVNRTSVAPKMQVWVKRTVENEAIGPWTLGRVVVTANGFNYEISFTQSARASDYLSYDVWPFVFAYLPENRGEFVLTAKDALFEGSEILLRGVNVTGHADREGVQTVLLSFRAVIGSIAGFFTPQRMPNLLREVECGLSTRTLNDVLIPALNIAATDPISVFDHYENKIEDFIERLKENKKEIEFYAELLSRFIAAREREGLPVVETPRSLRTYRDLDKFLDDDDGQTIEQTLSAANTPEDEFKQLA